MRKKPIQQRSRQLVENIIEATGKVIAEEGLDALTTNRVAEMVGISNGSLYQYFHDRADLIEALLEKNSQDIVHMFNQQLKVIDTRVLDVRTLAKIGLNLALTFLRSNALYVELLHNWHRLPMHRVFDPLEQYFLQMSRVYFLEHADSYPLKNLQIKLYVLINSSLFTMLRYLSQENPFMKDAEIVDCLADTIALVLEADMKSDIKDKV